MLRALYLSRLDGLRPVVGDSDGVAAADVVREARRGAIAVQREALAELADEGEISDESAGLLERELDLEEAMSAR
jgi:hypothetical protein